jgi:hypothetical protein
MATCAVTGEAAGAGAALSARLGVTPRALVRDHLGTLRSTLLRQDASVVGVPWDDTRDLALRASATASTTLERLAGDAGADATLVPIGEVDFGLVLPVHPRLDVVRLGVEAARVTTATVELWSTGNGLNHIPVRKLAAKSVTVASPGRTELEARFDFVPEAPCDVVVVVRRNPDLAVVVDEQRRPPYGVLALLSRTPSLEVGAPQSNAWSAAELRRQTPAFTVEPSTAAYGAERVVGGLARPFDGPNLWASEPLTAGRGEFVELRWPERQTIGRIELIFNDDVDEDLVNLHHHRTPFLVMPELVRDYHLDVATPGGWEPLVTVAGNRVRRRVHELESPVESSALRVVVTATNGDERAMIVAVRVFDDAARATGVEWQERRQGATPRRRRPVMSSGEVTAK